MLERESAFEVREIDNLLIAKYSFKNQEGHPYEDGFPVIGDLVKIDGKSYLPVLVADGATRVKEADEQYPSVSPQKMAADIAIKKALNFISNQLKNNPTSFEEILRQAVISANKAVEQFNRNSNLSGYNLAATTLTCVLMEKNGKKVIYWASIGDSPIIVFSEGKARIINPLQTANKDRLEKETKQQLTNGENWSKWHRENLRNNHYDLNGIDIGYGVLTGEEKAENFIVSGSETIKKSNLVIVATDGLIRAGLSPIEEVLKNEKVSFEQKLPFAFGKVLTELGHKRNDDMTAVLIKSK